MTNQSIDYASTIKNSPLASRMGGIIKNTENGFQVTDAFIYSQDGKDIYSEDISVSFEDPGNDKSMFIEYGHRGHLRHYINSQVHSMDEVLEVLSEETVPFSESEWLKMWNNSSLSEKGSSAVIVGKNTLMVNEFNWGNGETAPLIVRAYLNTNSFKHYFTVFHPEFYVVYRDSFEEILEFIASPIEL